MPWSQITNIQGPQGDPRGGGGNIDRGNAYTLVGHRGLRGGAPALIRRLLLNAALAVWIGAPIVTMPSADAVPVEPHCVSQFWMYGLRATTRSICDGPIRPDGSWKRCREFYAPAYLASGRSYCSGWIYWTSCTYDPPRRVPEFDQHECYLVTPETVLPDEPGHID